MTCKEILAALQNLSARGMDFGTARTRAILDKLGCPDKKLKIVHIAGSNGKGSVAEYMTEILKAAGKKTGTFTSPAVYDYFEQFRIDGVPLDEELFCRAFTRCLEVADGATAFEVETAGALYAFALAGCEYAVVECGLGGTYDATNAVFRKEVALVTSVSLEHTAILGNTLESICKHKSGIIKNCPSVISGLNSKEVLSFFKNLGSVVADKPYCGVTMQGSAQPYNAAVAIEGAKILKIPEDAIYAGVKRANLCGRLEVITSGGRRYVLDGAHNPAGFKPLADFIKGFKGEVEIIFGCLSDKDIEGNLSQLSPLAKRITAVECDSPRAMNIEKIYAACRKYFDDVKMAESVARALENSDCGTVVVCGSFTLLKGAKQWIEKRL